MMFCLDKTSIPPADGMVVLKTQKLQMQQLELKTILKWRKSSTWKTGAIRRGLSRILAFAAFVAFVAFVIPGLGGGDLVDSRASVTGAQRNRCLENLHDAQSADSQDDRMSGR